MRGVVVASFNVHWGLGAPRDGYPPFDVATACAALDADVLVVQEAWAPDVGPPQHDLIAAATGLEVVATAALARTELEPKPTIAARGGDPAGGGTGTWLLAVLTGLPHGEPTVVGFPQLRFDPVARAAVVLDVQTDGGPLTVVATHLPHLEVGSLLRGPALRRVLPPVDRPAALVGDMNMWSPLIAAMTPRGWRRAVRGRTWPARRPHSQIDHVLVTPPVRVLEAEVVDLVASDHRPVRARLAI